MQAERWASDKPTQLQRTLQIEKHSLSLITERVKRNLKLPNLRKLRKLDSQRENRWSKSKATWQLYKRYHNLLLTLLFGDKGSLASRAWLWAAGSLPVEGVLRLDAILDHSVVHWLTTHGLSFVRADFRQLSFFTHALSMFWYWKLI